MNEALRSRYLHALSVPEFLHVQYKTQDLSVNKIDTQCLVIETENVRSFCQPGKYQDFLLKMLSAIGLSKDDIQCVSINIDDLTRTLAQYNAKTVLLMGESLSVSSEHHFLTHHPSTILTNEQFKREAWEVLKKIKLCLK